MSSLILYILIALSATFTLTKGELSVGIHICKEQVITQCPCGLSGNVTDVYVDGCRVVSNESHPCQPCPGSCQLFLNCEKCSKRECVSCPIGKTGPTCANDIKPHSNNNSITEDNDTTVQNVTEVHSIDNSTVDKVGDNEFNEPMPKMVVFDISKIEDSSLRPVVENDRAEIKLDMIEFNTRNASIVEVFPGNTPLVIESNLMDSNNDTTNYKQTEDKDSSNDERKGKDPAATASNKNVPLHVETQNEIVARNLQNNDTKSEIDVENLEKDDTMRKIDVGNHQKDDTMNEIHVVYPEYDDTPSDIGVENPQKNDTMSIMDVENPKKDDTTSETDVKNSQQDGATNETGAGNAQTNHIISEIDVENFQKDEIVSDIDVRNLLKNNNMNAPYEGREVSGEYLAVNDGLTLEIQSVIGSEHTSDDLENDDILDRLKKHRSPNPSDKEDDHTIDSHVFKKILSRDFGQLQLEDVHQQDLDSANQQDLDNANEQHFDNVNEQHFDNANEQHFDNANEQHFDNDNEQHFDNDNEQHFDNDNQHYYDSNNQHNSEDVNQHNSEDVNQHNSEDVNQHNVEDFNQHDLANVHKHDAENVNQHEVDNGNAHDIENVDQKSFDNLNEQRHYLGDPVYLGDLGSDLGNEHNSKTTAETKYVYLSAGDLQQEENEAKYSDLEFESNFPEEKGRMENVELKETEGIEAMQPDQQYDFSKPHELKQYFNPKEGDNTQSENISPAWKNFCEVYPDASVCRQTVVGDVNTPLHDPHLHIEHTIDSYFRSPIVANSKDQNESMENFAKEQSMDTNPQQNDKYYESQIRPVPRLDIIQQHNDEYFKSLGVAHKPIPENLGIYDQISNPLHVDQENTMEQSPVVPKASNIPANFQKNLVTTLFDHLLRLIGPHIKPFQEDRRDNKIHVSPKFRIGSEMAMDILPSFKSFPALSPAIAHSLDEGKNQNSSTSFNFRNMDPNSFISAGQPRAPVVKGQILIANIAQNENGTDARVVPGSVRTQNFEFEIPVPMPSLYSGGKEAKPKHGKGWKRMKKLHKRRRNGVKVDSGMKFDPFKEDCTKVNGKKIARKWHISSSKKGGSIPGRVHIKFMKTADEPISDSEEISAISLSKPSDKNAVYLQADVLKAKPLEMSLENKNSTIEEDVTQESDNTNSDSGSNGPFNRPRRSVKEEKPHSHFCPIPRESWNGDLDCTIWSYKKSCNLDCHPGYTSPTSHFTCHKSKNTWVPAIVSCTGEPAFEPEAPPGIQLKHLEDMPPSLDDEEEEKEEEEKEIQEEVKEEPSEESNEKSSEEMKVQRHDHEEQVTTVNPVKHSHKKKAHVNSVKVHDESYEEVKHEHAHKIKDHGKGHAKKQHKSKHHKEDIEKPEVKDEEEESSKQEDAAKVVSDEDQNETNDKPSVEEIPNDTEDVAKEEQEIPEIEQNDVDEDYDDFESKK